jgi:hypothetical protein
VRITGPVVVMNTREGWMNQIIRGLRRIDAALGPDQDMGDALTCWTADPQAFADVVHGLVALGVPVEGTSLALAGIDPPPPQIGRDG